MMKKFILWAPRVLSILFILFISIFALDAFEEGMPLWKQMLGFLIHLVPTYILIAFLLAAWKFPLIGGLLFIGIGIFYILFARNFNVFTYLIISGPAILTGVLFIAQKFIREESRPIT
jgi:hypothetical protein